MIVFSLKCVKKINWSVGPQDEILGVFFLLHVFCFVEEQEHLSLIGEE